MVDADSSPVDLQDWQCFCGYENAGLDAYCARCGLSVADSQAKFAQAEAEEQARIAAANTPISAASQTASAAVAEALAPGGGGLAALPLAFNGSGGSLLGQMLLVMLLTAITFGIYGFWGQVRITSWLLNHTLLDGRKLAFSGTGLELLGLGLLHMILISLTLSIWTPWAVIALTKWHLAHICYADAPV